MLGLSHPDLKLYQSALRNPHDVSIAVDLLDLDGNVLGSVTPKMLDGQVQGDRHGFGDPRGPQRKLTLTLLDPNNALNVDTDDPDDGTVYYDRLIRVTYSVYVVALDDWIDVPVFTGPPWALQRTNDEVYIEADDVSALGWGNAWRPKTIAKGKRKVDAIREILSSRAGFTRFDLPERKARLAHPVSLGRMQHPWGVAARIAASMDLQLYVDGAGTVCARRLPTNPLWTFNPGEGGEIIDPLALSTDRGRFANTVEVIGRKPKGAKRRVRARAVAPRKHPHSPWNLARDGQPYFKVERIRNDHLRTTAECERKAQRILEDRLRSLSEQTCSILPWPHLTPGDLARFTTLGGESTVDRIESFTLPLGLDGAPAMTLNWLDRPAPHRRKVRR